MESKFYTLLKEYYDRNSIGGFLPGDFVELDLQKAKDAHCADGVLNILDHMDKNDHSRLVVTKISRQNVGVFRGNNSTLPEHLVIDVAEEIAPGLYLDPIPVPACAVKRVNTGVNLGEVPSGWKYTPKLCVREFDPETDHISEPDYNKYKKYGMDVLNRWIDGHNPHERGVNFTSQGT